MLSGLGAQSAFLSASAAYIEGQNQLSHSRDLGTSPFCCSKQREVLGVEQVGVSVPHPGHRVTDHGSLPLPCIHSQLTSTPPVEKVQVKGFVYCRELIYLYLMYMNVLPACMPVCHVYAWFPWRPEEDNELPGTGDSDVCELICECSELNRGPLEEKQVLLTTQSSLISFGSQPNL